MVDDMSDENGVDEAGVDSAIVPSVLSSAFGSVVSGQQKWVLHFGDNVNVLGVLAASEEWRVGRVVNV